jgi:hypothetical protein
VLFVQASLDQDPLILHFLLSLGLQCATTPSFFFH